MKIAACQFAVSGNIRRNLSAIIKYTLDAAQQGAELIVFPECALTGYPPLDMPSSASVDWQKLETAHQKLQLLSAENKIHILSGTITHSDEGRCNSAILFSPDKEPVFYHKRALWGWDRENFIPGSEKGLFQIGSLSIGVRICYEIRFPEYFRELYRERTDLNIVLFHDTSSTGNPDRYELIKAHLRTRAAENITPVLSVNTCAAYQTAPTALINASGKIFTELPCGTEGLLVYDLQPVSPDFSDQGRKELSDSLLGIK